MQKRALIEVLRVTEQWVHVKRLFVLTRDVEEEHEKLAQLYDLIQEKEAALFELFEKLDNGFKYCPRCGQLLAPDLFYNSHDYCKVCLGEYNKLRNSGAL